MNNPPNYWLVGANWLGDDQASVFFRRGYWVMGHDDENVPVQASRRDQIKVGDRIAIKKLNGRAAKTITIIAIGIVKDIADKKVYIDWKLIDMNRFVPSHGAFTSIHGPYLFTETWVQEIFSL